MRSRTRRSWRRSVEERVPVSEAGGQALLPSWEAGSHVPDAPELAAASYPGADRLQSLVELGHGPLELVRGGAQVGHGLLVLVGHLCEKG
jgi:hypothetical protein